MATAKSLYAKMEGDRHEFLERARAAAELTLPYIMTREGHNSTEDLPTPYQSVGARGVNNLSAKMLMALFPVNQSVFRLTIDDATLEELTQAEGQRALVEEALNSMERTSTSFMEGAAFRPALYEALRHGVVVGNCCLNFTDDEQLRVLSLEKYVVKRSPSGTLLRLITKEAVVFGELGEDVQELIKVSQMGSNKYEEDTQLDLYTHIVWKKNKYHVVQEVEGIELPETRGSYNKDKLPYIPLRFNRVAGENYGRGFVEEYIGDLISHEGLSQALLEGAAGAARLLFLVNPNGTTDKEDLANAPNGEFVDGSAADVQALQVQKAGDFQVAERQMQAIESRLSYAFLLNSAVQRGGERVTAEEIRYVAQELEAALGGIYSILTQELQLPLVNLVMGHLERKGKLPKLPKDSVRPVVVTGVEALGRGQDLARLREFVSTVASLPGAIERLNVDDLMKRVGSALGIDMKGLVKSAEQMQQEQQQAMMQQAAMSAAGPVAGQVAKGAVDAANAPAGEMQA